MKDILRKIGRKSRITNLSDKMRCLKNCVKDGHKEYREFEESTSTRIIKKIRNAEEERKKKTRLTFMIFAIVSILVLMASFLLHK